MFFFDARIFTLVVEYCGCVKRRPDYGSGNIHLPSEELSTQAW